MLRIKTIPWFEHKFTVDFKNDNILGDFLGKIPINDSC